MIDVDNVMTVLAGVRPIFHSEADFQHAFAWELHKRLPDAAIRLELPHALPNKPIHVDIFVRHNDVELAVELKYATRSFAAEIQGEAFALKNHGAQDLRRYDFVKDIERVEHIISGQEQAMGFAILLTNDSLFWREGRDGSIDADFHLWQGRVLHGTARWGKKAGAGTMKGREAPLTLAGSYAVDWRDYSTPSLGKGGQFRYLALHVESQGVSGDAALPKVPAKVAPTSHLRQQPSDNQARAAGKYGALTTMLANDGRDVCVMRFADIATCVGSLPTSAYQYREWWANHSGNPQARGWLGARYEVETVDISGLVVTFRRR